jgi:hypothetical protein
MNMGSVRNSNVQVPLVPRCRLRRVASPLAERRFFGLISSNTRHRSPLLEMSGGAAFCWRTYMTTIRQFIQTSPAKADELFAKLLDTSDNATKTRERLLPELKEELELVAKLEEQHLFPALKKHKQTKGLVQHALSDNKETRRLLAQLERTPPNDESFIAKVSELRKSFQRHVRDEKKELLPAVLKALSDEETEAVLTKIEDDKAEIEAAKRAEAEGRRAEAREQREQAATVHRAAEGIADNVRSIAEGARQAARTTEDTVRTGFGTAFDFAQRSTDEMAQLLSGSGKHSQETAGQAAEGLQAVTQSSTALVRGFQEASRECLQMSQHGFQANVEAFTALAACRSLPEFVAAQAALVRRNVELAVENSQKLTQLSLRFMAEVTGNVAGQTEGKRGRRRPA